MGRDYSVADAHFFVVSNWASWLDFDLSPYRAVLAHRERVGSRPAVVAALKTEGLVPSGHVATLTPDIPTTDTDQGTKSRYLPSRMTAFLLSNRMLYRAT